MFLSKTSVRLLLTSETFTELDESVMLQVLGVSADRLAEVAVVANRYPNIKLEAVLSGDDAASGDVEVEIAIERQGFEEEEGLGPVVSPHYPETKQEYWWIMIGDSDRNLLFRLKRVEFLGSWTSKLAFKITEPGQYKLTVYLICDSYIGCDLSSDPMPVTVEAEGLDN